jgi:Uma2 family endonuclease
MMNSALQNILQRPDLEAIIHELNETWANEQRKRHEFWAEIDENTKAEFILGEIIYHSPIYGRHWMASSQITRRLIPYVYDNSLGMVAYEKVMVRMTRNDYEPDICFWRKEKAQNFTQKQSAFPPPDFIVEILSESTKERDYGIKKTDYELHGVEEYWIIDPENQFVEQYLLKNQVYELNFKANHGTIQSVVIIGFEMKVEDIFKE